MDIIYRTMHQEQTPSNYRWYILTLAAMTSVLAVAAPVMCMPVLFKEISQDLHLTLVQVGLVWGIGSLPGIFTALVAGAIGDRFGPKRILVLGCLLTGLFSALRGTADSFVTLSAAVVMLGFFNPFIQMNIFKTCGIWFPPRQLGLANGVISMGMALGFLIGSMVSATVLSPWLGGWRNVMFFYGIIAMALSIPWFFTRLSPAAAGLPAGGTGSKPMRQTIAHVARLRNIWLLGLAILGIGGCIQGTLGYLPLYLTGQGWTEVAADAALAAFHTVSLLCVIPIALFSDRFGSRKKVLLAAALMVAMGVTLLSVVDGMLVWLAVCMAGMVRDGFMAVFMTSIIETRGVGPAFAGSATGFVMIFSGLGALLAPPLGNSLAAVDPGLPFIFWAVICVAGMTSLYAIRASDSQRIYVPDGDPYPPAPSATPAGAPPGRET
jgi:MFS family permease